MRLSARCFALTGLGYVPPWTVNAGFVCGDEITLIVDTGANTAAAQTIHGYAQAARPSNRILVIDTERHFDHIGGNSYFRRFGIDVYGHESIARTAQEFHAEIAEFAAQIPNERRREAHEENVFYAATDLANPNRPIREDREFDLGGCSVQIILTPGHTPSNLSVYVPGEGVLYCGDCLINGYLPNLDCGAVPQWQQWLHSIDRIEQLAPSTVVPGHGPIAQGADVSRIIAQVRTVLQEAIPTRTTPAAGP